jgi:hypothetical protein
MPWASREKWHYLPFSRRRRKGLPLPASPEALKKLGICNYLGKVRTGITEGMTHWARFLQPQMLKDG